MGLAEPRVKQRISADPRNLAWSNDQSKYGYRMLSKMGWSPGKGLGINEDGNKEHTKLSIKRDNLGVGADTDNSINNWLDNSNSFDELLKGLNDKFQTGEKEQEKWERGRREKRGSEQDIGDEAKIDKVKSKKKKKNKKGYSNKNKKSIITSELSNNNNLTANTSDSKSLSSVRLAHRAKFLKSKKAAIQDSDRLNEILGIKSNKNSSKNSDNTSIDLFSTINTSASSSNSDESDMKYSRKNIRKVDTTNKVNEMSINEYFAQKMKGLRTPSGTANRVNFNEANDDTDKQSSFSMGECPNLMDNNTSLKSSRSISNCSLKLMSNKKRKIDYDIDIESS